MRMKIEGIDEQEVFYTKEHWQILRNLRRRAASIVIPLAEYGIETLTYGSIARGDVHPGSDIDILILQQIPSYRINLILDEIGVRILEKTIIQATPNDIIKGHFQLEDDITLTLVLTKWGSLGDEFYRYGGAITSDKIETLERVPGVDKRLRLIIPTPKGHYEYSLHDNKEFASKNLGVSLKIIEQRLRVLERRDKVGRTGVFIRYEIPVEDTFEEHLRNLAKKNRMVRRRISM